MKVTRLVDIADRVGVSISSVSLVLNGLERGRVRPESAERIREVAQELGYLPNLAARGLRTRQTLTIGVLARRVATTDFAAEMLAGAQNAAWEAGFVMLLVDTDGNEEAEESAINALQQRNVEALVLATEFHQVVQLPDLRTDVPIVILDGVEESGQEADSVVPDEAAGAYAATRHLIENGHRRIALCNLPESTYIAATLRRRGYEAALEVEGIQVDPSLIVEAQDPEPTSGRMAAQTLMTRDDVPTAVFCASDRLAVGFYQYAAAHGLSIPRDLSIVGFDNQRISLDYLVPPLTTVQLPHREMGAWAIKRAIARARGEERGPAVSALISCPLVPRDSVASPRRNGHAG